MNILVCGAGVIGTLYAARLQEAGHRVTVLARGPRLVDIQRYGLVLEDILSGTQSTTLVETVERPDARVHYDLALVMVRRDQLSGIIPGLAVSRNIPTVLFMLNNPMGSADLAAALGAARVVMGFPGAGGTLDGHVVRYAMIAEQPTTLGEPGGALTSRVEILAGALRQAGFQTRIDTDIDAWLCAHAFFVTSVSGAIYLAAGDCERLSRDAPLLKLMVAGVREGFRVVRALGRPVHPAALNVLFTWLPSPFAVYYWRRYLARPMADYIFGRHARHSSLEMRALATDCRLLIGKTTVAAPALTRLYGAIDDYTARCGPDSPPKA